MTTAPVAFSEPETAKRRPPVRRHSWQRGSSSGDTTAELWRPPVLGGWAMGQRLQTPARTGPYTGREQACHQDPGKRMGGKRQGAETSDRADPALLVRGLCSSPGFVPSFSPGTPWRWCTSSCGETAAGWTGGGG